ncbi:phosphoribosylglycinamide formyltransferase [Georgenia thermotolerans]|uniref:Phosphoribosylglycinamide formyltransferase n=1 Tax=Georgenia thermotolerans TaxID=527326 RepID=A0A7J5UIR8_9MICO|nr:phosphoribosylglycinamide formyltransferase [Georgenia thermotolerans]
MGPGLRRGHGSIIAHGAATLAHVSVSTPRPARLVVLVSGGGSNLAALLEATQDPAYGAQVVAVGADREGTGGVDLARAAGLATFVERVGDHATREEWDAALTAQVAAHQPDLVVSAGFLKLCGQRFLERFGGRYINTHNTLLPAFPGIHGPRDALAYGVKLAGATLFFVDAGVDTGAIVAQVAVPVLDDDDVATLTERIKVAERAQLVEQVGRLAREGWRIEGRRVLVGAGR